MKVQITLLASVILQSCFGMSLTAYRQGAEAKIVYRVVDDEGYPVSNARVQVWFRSDYPKLDIRDWVMSTDTNGEFVAKCQTNERVSIGVDKEGYYHTFDRVTFRSNANEYKIVDGKWQPYGVLRTIVLKKIKKPIEINRHSTLDLLKVPVYDKWIGFDFNRYSFVFPHGDGEQSDVQVCFTLVDTPELGYHAQMMLSFTNNPYAGAYLIKGDESSEFQSPYTADTNAFYQGHYVFSYDQDPNRPPKRNEIKDGEYFIFRTRTIVDHQGRLVSAHYGRLGGWEFVGPAGIRISKLVFNPTPNDTNLEDAETARKSRLAYKQQIEFERRRKAQGK